MHMKEAFPNEKSTRVVCCMQIPISCRYYYVSHYSSCRFADMLWYIIHYALYDTNVNSIMYFLLVTHVFGWSRLHWTWSHEFWKQTQILVTRWEHNFVSSSVIRSRCLLSLLLVENYFFFNSVQTLTFENCLPILSFSFTLMLIFH